MAEHTISSVPLHPERERPADVARPYLVVMMLADDPTLPSSRHLLDDVDEVRFGRGPRRATRVVDGRRSTLEIRIPDPRMSADHGKLFRGPLGWVLEDLRSKNGAVVDGVATRRSVVSDGTIIELGHTCWMFCVAPVEADAVADRMAGDAALAAGLATFDGPLADSFAALARVARTPVSVILLGETGTGKELVARALHELSSRAGAVVAVNCGALPGTLLEAELFGSRQGAYTGATHDRVGLVRSADRGTLFLDEIGELPQPAQAAFLRVLQEREVTPVGGDRPVKVDLRLCVATLRDLSTLVERGAFRHDLYARLLGFTLTLPPLRERLVDFGLIASALLARAAGGRAIRLSLAALRVLLRHDWPLNIRELEKTLGTAVALATNNVIDLAQLPKAIRHPQTSTTAGEPGPALSAEDAALRDRLIGALVAHNGNVVAVGKELGVRRTQIYRWAHRFGIDVARFRT
jgi:transcriptional regulator of acetoin/glycerol metabolism